MKITENCLYLRLTAILTPPTPRQVTDTKKEKKGNLEQEQVNGHEWAFLMKQYSKVMLTYKKEKGKFCPCTWTKGILFLLISCYRTRKIKKEKRKKRNSLMIVIPGFVYLVFSLSWSHISHLVTLVSVFPLLPSLLCCCVKLVSLSVCAYVSYFLFYFDSVVCYVSVSTFASLCLSKSWIC